MNWTSKRLSEVADFCLGKMLDEKKNKGKYSPYLANINVRWGEFDLDNLREMRFEYHELDRFNLNAGDILMCEGGEPGRCAIWKEQKSDIMFQKAIHRIRPHECLDNKFLFYSLFYKAKAGYLSPLFTGTTIKHLPREKLAKVIVEIPPLSIQHRIASTLSAYDELIENNKRRIQLLERAARLIYKEWFVHLRFPGYEQVAITDGVPEGWHICRITEHPYFEFIREKIAFFDGHKRYYATADIDGIFITGKGIKYSYHAKPSRAQKSPEINSVWFARMQETYKVLVFTAANQPMVENSILSSGFAGFRACRPEFLPFLFLLINNERFFKEKDRFCNGATQRSLADTGLKNIRVIVPAVDLIEAFSVLTSPMIDQILYLQRANAKLRQARDLLLPRLMKGEIAV